MATIGGLESGRQAVAGHRTVARLEANLLPLCLCAQRTAGGVDHLENKIKKKGGR